MPDSTDNPQSTKANPEADKVDSLFQRLDFGERKDTGSKLEQAKDEPADDKPDLFQILNFGKSENESEKPQKSETRGLGEDLGSVSDSRKKESTDKDQEIPDIFRQLQLFDSRKPEAKDNQGADGRNGEIKKVTDKVEESDQAGKGKDPDIAPSPYVMGEAFRQLGVQGMPTDGWEPENDFQRKVLEQSNSVKGDLSELPKKILDSKAEKGSVDGVNEFLEKKGFDIKLDPIGEKDVAVAATLSMKGEWKGKNNTITAKDGKEYPGFTKDAKVFNVDGKSVVELYTDPETGYKVYIAPQGDLPKGYDAYDVANKLTPNKDSEVQDYEKVHAPKVSLDVESELENLKGLKHKDGSTIAQAKMQTILNMDETGFEAKQAVAMAVSRGFIMPKPTFKVDEPFVMWVQYPGMEKPLIAIPVDQQHWKAPPKKAK